jgi:hypothetical protein
VTKFLDGAPGAEAGVASLALGAVGVVTGVLVKRHSVCEMRCAYDITTAAAVMLAEVPCEVGLAESACISGLVGLGMMLVFDHQGMLRCHVRSMVYVLDGRLIGTPRFAPV